LPDRAITAGEVIGQSDIIERLRDEHRSVEKLLFVLEQELAVFDRRERPDYEVLQAVVRVFEDYSACWHDPKERVVFDALRECDAEAAAMIDGLEIEHRQDLHRLQRLAQALTSILIDRDVPPQAFDQVVRDFIGHLRHQIDFEERVLFPAALKALQSEDWATIEAQLNDGGGLSSNGTSEDRFHALSERILNWEQGNLMARA
jgi:hemerythrin-like domain-containing protein